jgi:kynurenine formamidase
VGRGILVDFVRWREETGQAPIPADSPYGITVAELEAVARHQNLEFRPADILLVRTGFTLWHEQASQEERVQKLDKLSFIGVERTEEMKRFLWNKHFSAVGTDSIGFEQCPAPFGQKGAVVLHEWILAHWGMPLGELWNLEPLSRLCKEQHRWSFFFTSAPLYVKGGVGSPPNAIAVL